MLVCTQIRGGPPPAPPLRGTRLQSSVGSASARKGARGGAVPTRSTMRVDAGCARCGQAGLWARPGPCCGSVLLNSPCPRALLPAGAPGRVPPASSNVWDPRCPLAGGRVPPVSSVLTGLAPPLHLRLLFCLLRGPPSLDVGPPGPGRAQLMSFTPPHLQTPCCHIRSHSQGPRGCEHRNPNDVTLGSRSRATSLLWVPAENYDLQTPRTVTPR